MEDFERGWSAAVYRINEALRCLSPDFLLAFGATCSLVAILFVRAWLRVIRRNKALKLQIRSLTDELAVVRKNMKAKSNGGCSAQPARLEPSGDQVK